MDIKQALSRARKLLGPDAAIRDSKTPSSPEQREEAWLLRIERKRIKDAAQIAVDKRCAEILAADAEYQRLHAEYIAAKERLSDTAFGCHYRYAVGTVNSLFFSVKAQADTLDELIEKLAVQEAA